MVLEVLLSCMNQKDLSLIENSNITTNALIVNQCDKNNYCEIVKNNRMVRMISTCEKGLSNSRNMAITHALGDICLLCDDDELFVPNYEQLILAAFESLPQADIIAFEVTNKITNLEKRIQKINYFSSLRLSSVQLAFRRQSIVKNNIHFDPYMGAGTGNGCGEENKFLIDCLKKKLVIYYFPSIIATLKSMQSTWFSGYGAAFFFQRGCSTRYMMGLIPALLYGSYYILVKRELYKNYINPINAYTALVRGIFANNINKGKNTCQK